MLLRCLRPEMGTCMGIRKKIFPGVALLCMAENKSDIQDGHWATAWLGSYH